MSTDPLATAPRVTAVLVCRNEARIIASCVESLLAQVPPPGGFEILVVDGMSDDGTRPILQDLVEVHSELRFIDNPQKITPCGMNAGIRAARGSWVAILGAHNRYAPDYLLQCYNTAMDTGADNVGGAMFCEGTTLVQRAIAASHHSPISCGGAAWHDPGFEGQVDTVFGGFYRREIFDRIGLFDESLVRNQDDELNLRLIRSGGKIFQSPKVRSWYKPRASLGALFKQYLQYGYWKVKVIQKHRLPASFRHLVPAAFLVTLLVLLTVSIAGFLWSLGSNPPSGLWRAPAGVLAALVAFYCISIVAASMLTASKTEWKLLRILPFVFPCYHFGYGYGFLRGMYDFVIRKGKSDQSFSSLTR